MAPSLESFHLVDWSSFWAVDDAVEQWIVDPVLPKGRSTAIYAPAKTGKSLLALEIAAAVATGRRIMHQQDGQARSTLYLDYEMTEDDLRDRLISLGYRPEDDLSLLHYALLPSLPPLNTAAGGDELGRLVEALAVEVVIIDTFGRAAEGEENSNDTTRSFYAHSGVMLKRLGVTSLRLDHAGKDLAKGQRSVGEERRRGRRVAAHSRRGRRREAQADAQPHVVDRGGGEPPPLREPAQPPHHRRVVAGGHQGDRRRSRCTARADRRLPARSRAGLE
ncbi:MAG: AAA family ATPase [Acidimicrobiales bacterium]